MECSSQLIFENFKAIEVFGRQGQKVDGRRAEEIKSRDKAEVKSKSDIRCESWKFSSLRQGTRVSGLNLFHELLI